MTSKPTHPVRKAGLKLAALTLGCALTFNVSAGIPTFDYTNMINMIVDRFQTIAEWGREYNRWREQMNVVQRQLISIKAMLTKFSMPGASNGVHLTELDEAEEQRKKCGTSGGLSNPLQGLSLDPNAEIIEQQTQICLAITKLQVFKFNETVKFMNQTLPAMERDLNAIDSRRSGSENDGVTQAAQVDSTQFGNKYAILFQGWKSRMDVYDTAIESLEDQQRSLSQIALKGERTKNAIGQVGKTLMLERALK